jgi:branched-chain amino acid transport system permease protein
MTIPAARLEPIAALRRPRSRLPLLHAIALSLAVFLPFAISNYRVFQVTQLIIHAIALLGLNLLTGYNGQISLGHGAFYAIGAYTAAILMNRYDLPYWLTLPCAAVVCLGLGFSFGWPALRLEGSYLALATFALGVSMPQILKYKHFESWTGGVQGLTLTKPAPPWGLPLSPDQWLYFFSLAIMLVLFAWARTFLRGHAGLSVVAIREHPVAASAVGIDVPMYKALTFGISAMYTGVAGALGGIAVQFVSPDSFPALLSMTFLVGIVVGGLASISGALYGAIFIQFVPTLASEVSRAAPGVVYGLVLMGAVYAMPRGIAGGLKRLAELWRERGPFPIRKRRNHD